MREGVGGEGLGEATGEDANGRDGRCGIGHGGEVGGHGGGRRAISSLDNIQHCPWNFPQTYEQYPMQ
jgi:hypothetical protein